MKYLEGTVTELAIGKGILYFILQTDRGPTVMFEAGRKGGEKSLTELFTRKGKRLRVEYKFKFRGILRFAKWEDAYSGALALTQ